MNSHLSLSRKQTSVRAYPKVKSASVRKVKLVQVILVKVIT